ncbi:Uncharacterized membrane protein YoaK, UPF0700 family [Hespellia stercorisuis DSM 15480]|uniref:Uncharacterized membrane protein YoaK, UPF0700 family n=2 Tax=Hespellia stercorisuis TaxID=180311 RepID=A0A1M6PBV7_9FIRM|nr:YoaK family protein [Hespellia stercorisuis]SHK05435.1 Uncharacterized membrane protein YoaK, UPF0700 family [Hespellia stercorisuis DSM 15480]
MSESIRLGVILAVSGGLMDAYSYIGRDQVFANAQTGNMLLLGISLAQKNWVDAVRYLFPVLAFTIGIAMADIVRIKLKKMSVLHWRQVSALTEALILIAVSFMPQSMNLWANSLASLACGIQVESFRKIRGNGAATTMCIGNLRSATQNVCEYWFTRDKERLEKGGLYFGLIVCFITGAVIGNEVLKVLHERTILVSSGLLLIAFAIMFIDKEQEKK